MSSEVSDTPVGTSTEPAPEQKGVEEQKQPSLQDRLLAELKAEGQLEEVKPGDPVPLPEPNAEVPAPEEQDQPPEELPSTEAEGEGEPEPEEELEPAAAKKPDTKKLVPLGEVLEEREKKKRANDRADRAESEFQKAQNRISELEAALANSGGPIPNEDNPVVDIQDPRVLDKLERVYEAVQEVDLENVNEDGTVTVPADWQNGQFIYRKLDPKDARLAQIRANRAVRKFIPQRRGYLDERAKVDANAVQWYPDLQNTEHEFTKMVNQLTNNVLSGRAMQQPDVKFWVANAVYGYMKRQEEAKASEGNGKASNAQVRQIVESSREKVAPTAPRGRTLPQQKTSVADLAKAKQRMEANPDDKEAFDAYIAAVRKASTKGQKPLEPIAE